MQTKSATTFNAKKITRTRSAMRMKMESLLSLFIEHQVANRIPLRKMQLANISSASVTDHFKSDF